MALVVYSVGHTHKLLSSFRSSSSSNTATAITAITSYSYPPPPQPASFCALVYKNQTRSNIVYMHQGNITT